MYRSFFRLTSPYTFRDGFVEYWRRNFSTPFLLPLFKTTPTQRSPYRSSPYELDGATRRRFASSSRIRLHLLLKTASSSSSISGLRADLTIIDSVTGSSAVLLNFNFVIVLQAQTSGTSTATLQNPHTRLFCNFELLASLTFTEQKLTQTLWRDIFLPPTTDVMNFAASDNRALFLNSLLGAIIQSTHPTEIDSNKLKIRTINDTVTLFQRDLTFDDTLRPIKKVD